MEIQNQGRCDRMQEGLKKTITDYNYKTNEAIGLPYLYTTGPQRIMNADGS